MKALFLDAYFYPEKIAFTHLENDLIQALLKAGHVIEVICPTPTRGISKEIAQRYASTKQESLYDGQLQVRRFWAPQEGRNPVIRALRYFWCNIRQYQLGRSVKNADVVFAVSTPPTQGFLAGKLSRKLGCRFVYSLQDVFPDSLITTRLAKKGSLIWKIGRAIEDRTYKSADAIVAVSRSMKDNILQKGVPEEKVAVISNWIDLDAVKPVPKEENRLFEELRIRRDVFTVVYAGNFGAAQGADVVLEAAKLLRDVQFVIFGGGVEFESAKQKAVGLPNVIINELLPQDRISEVYSLGDVCLITSKKGVGTSGMPSKTWSIMACATPIIAAFDTDSDLAECIARANAGLCVEPENPQVLAAAIRAQKNMPPRRTDAREYVYQHAAREACTERYLELMQDMSQEKK